MTQTRAFLTSGPIGCILFILAFLMEGATRNGYDPLRFPVSSLSIGPLGWMQITNFIVSGSLIFLSAFGLHQVLSPAKGAVWISRWVGAVGIGLVGAGICVSDPVYGYPSNLPLALSQFTLHGHLHDFFSMFVFAGLPVASFKCYNLFKREHKTGWAVYSLLSGIGILLMFILTSMGFKQTPGLVDFAGLFQRLTIVIGLVWLGMVEMHFGNKLGTKPSSRSDIE